MQHHAFTLLEVTFAVGVRRQSGWEYSVSFQPNRSLCGSSLVVPHVRNRLHSDWPFRSSQMYLGAVAGRKVILYICFLDEAHGSSSRSVACLEGARLKRSPECRRREGGNSVSSKHTLTMARVPECPGKSLRAYLLTSIAESLSKRDRSCSHFQSRRLRDFDEAPRKPNDSRMTKIVVVTSMSHVLAERATIEVCH